MTETLNSTKTYVVDTAHSHVRFWVRHLMISKVHGEFGSVSGAVDAVPGQPTTGLLDVTVDVTSINTGNEGRDGHLKSPDFFDVEKFPTMTYRSTKVTELGDGEYEVQGDLTIRGVTKPVALRAEISEEIASPFGGTKVGVSATGKIDREAFGLTWNQALETGGVAVGKEVNIQIDVELDRAAE
ncbi:polyisoprenoid-binding protein [bacterium]|nr:MAG: polyisoprenoid-binding protein [bacterium]